MFAVGRNREGREKEKSYCSFVAAIEKPRDIEGEFERVESFLLATLSYWTKRKPNRKERLQRVSAREKKITEKEGRRRRRRELACD